MFRRISEQTGEFVYYVSVTPNENSGEFSFGFSGESGLGFSYNLKNGKVFDSDENFLSYYRRNTEIEFSGNVFSGYSNIFINENLKNNNLTKQTQSIDRFFFDANAASYNFIVNGEKKQLSVSGQDFLNNNQTGFLTINNLSQTYFNVFSGNVLFSGDGATLFQPFTTGSYKKILPNSGEIFEFLFPTDLTTGEYNTVAEIYTDYGVVYRDLIFSSDYSLVADIDLSYSANYDFTGQNLFSINYSHREGPFLSNKSSDLYISLSKTGGPDKLKNLLINGNSINTGISGVDFSGYLLGSGNITGKILFDASGYNNYLNSVDSGKAIYNYITGTEFLTGNYSVNYDLIATGKGSGDVLTSFNITGKTTGTETGLSSGYITGSGQLPTTKLLNTSGYWGFYNNFYTGLDILDLNSEYIFSTNNINYKYFVNPSGKYSGNGENFWNFYSAETNYISGIDNSFIGQTVSSYRTEVSTSGGFSGDFYNHHGPNKYFQTGLGQNLSGYLYFSGYVNDYSNGVWLFANSGGTDIFGFSLTGSANVYKNKDNYNSNIRESIIGETTNKYYLYDTDNTTYTQGNTKITGLDFCYEVSGNSGVFPISNLSSNKISFFSNPMLDGSTNSLFNRRNNPKWIKFSVNNDDTYYFRTLFRSNYATRNNKNLNSNLSIYGHAYLISGTGNSSIISGLIESDDLDADFDALTINGKSGEEYAICFSTSTESQTGLFIGQFNISTSSSYIGDDNILPKDNINYSGLLSGLSIEDVVISSEENFSNIIYNKDKYTILEKDNENILNTTGTYFTGLITGSPTNGYLNVSENLTGKISGVEKDFLINPSGFDGNKNVSVSFDNIFAASTKMQIFIYDGNSYIPILDQPKTGGIHFSLNNASFVEEFNNSFSGYGFTGYENSNNFVAEYNNYLENTIRFDYGSTIDFSDNYQLYGIGEEVDSNSVFDKKYYFNESIASTGYYETGINIQTGFYSKSTNKYVNGLYRATGKITGVENITINNGSGYFNIGIINDTPISIGRIDGNTGQLNETNVGNFSGNYGIYIPSGYKSKNININLENLTGQFSGISYIKTFTGEHNLFLSDFNNFTGSGQDFLSLGFTGEYNSTGIKYQLSKQITGSDYLYLFWDKKTGFSQDQMFLEISGSGFYTGINVDLV